MSVVQIRPKSTQNYSIFRRGQVARAMFDRIINHHKTLPIELTSDVFIPKIENALVHCPASSLVGNNWDEIVQKCVEYLINLPNIFKEEDLKIRLFVRLLQHEQ
ncbi:MAG: hypothetical protein HRU38_11205 [Saccharospirillaceae bacterium]|nr:hypothetical protein [Pseudomonadales bacterium]NRB79221.1 hypothetical protein [Saccharospirillaceae bacterium]